MVNRRFKGVAFGLKKLVIGRFSRAINSGFEIIFLENSNQEKYIDPVRTKAIISIHPLKHSRLPFILSETSLEEICDGDILVMRPDGSINNLFQINSTHHSFLMTEMCNSKCLMCSQPPKIQNDIDELFEINKTAIPLVPKTVKQIGFSGGEPTLLKEKFVHLVSLVKHCHPEAHLHVLSNGRSFSDISLVDQVSEVGNKNLMFGIPLYADNYLVHDYVVQSKGAFEETMAGFYNLASRGIRIEIRVVLHKVTIPRLLELCKYIYKNLTFVEHVALMGLEYTGFAKFNYKDLEIDPYDYKAKLTEAVMYLNRMKINVSVYNLQLCITDPIIWPFMRKSISDWKNDYHIECNKCVMKRECPGFFTWNLKAVSSHIKAFENK